MIAFTFATVGFSSWRLPRLKRLPFLWFVLIFSFFLYFIVEFSLLSIKYSLNFNRRVFFWALALGWRGCRCLSLSYLDFFVINFFLKLVSFLFGYLKFKLRIFFLALALGWRGCRCHLFGDQQRPLLTQAMLIFLFISLFCCWNSLSFHLLSLPQSVLFSTHQWWLRHQLFLFWVIEFKCHSMYTSAKFLT